MRPVASRSPLSGSACALLLRCIVPLGFAATTVSAQGSTAAPSTAPPTAAECAALDKPMDHATMDHAAHQALLARCASASAAVQPTSPGQAAFGAIAEIVGILEADPRTDWSKVNLEALRQHLIDMDEVTMHAAVMQVEVPGGFRADVTGSGRTIDAIRRMTTSHARTMMAATGPRMSVAEIPSGARVTVTASDPADTREVARLRGLGFIGVLASGSHHQMHHLMIARGESPHAP